MRMGTVVLLLLVACGSSRKAEPPPAPAPDARTEPAEVTVARTLLEHVARGENDAAVAMMAVGPKPDEVAALWKDIAADGGELRATRATVDPADPRLVHVEAELKWGTVRALVGVVDGKVVRFQCKPLYTSPGYVDNQVTDEEVAIGSGKTALRGILSTPGGKGPFPVVLLVQGSGPSDLDEWSPGSPRMPFRDLAGGLASRGVAVLRVDKATWADRAVARGMTNENVTVKEEYLDPVGDALAFLAKRFDRVFVLGHSMGGWLLPWIMKDHPEVDGGIILAGNARHLADIIPEQDQYLARINLPGITDAQLEQLRQLDEIKTKNAHDPALADDTSPAFLPLGASAKSWKFVQGYDAPAVAAAVGRPFLLLQGGRDYNVTMVDHELWKTALAGQDVTAKAYPDLDHLFVTGTGKATPAERAQRGYVAQVVIDDIAAWVRGH